MHLPEEIISYIASLYGKLKGKVKTVQWISVEFSFNKGVFEGEAGGSPITADISYLF